MAFQPKPEPGSPPGFYSTAHTNYKEMSISELVSVLRSAYEMDEFDRVEQELVTRDADLKALVGPLKEEVQLQKLAMITAEKNLKEKEKECEMGKKAKESHESLLRKIKSKGLIDQNTVAELKIKNEALERENSELKALKRKWDADTATFAEVRSRLEIEKVGNEYALDNLKMKNTELAEVVKKNLETIEDLRAENNKLADEKRRFEELNETLETKFEELNERVLKLEVDTKVLMHVDDYASGGVDEHGITSAVNNTRGPTTPFQRNGDTQHSPPSKGKKDVLGDSDGGRLEKVEIINLDDDDDSEDGYTLQRFFQENSISKFNGKIDHQSSLDAAQPKSILTREEKKRKILAEYDTSSSNSIPDVDHLLSRHAFTSKKRK